MIHVRGSVFDTLNICSPKRNSRLQSGWEGFFPYYAGYSETFARALLSSADLSSGAVVFDPWNGSGTTTYSASLLGLSSCGFDLNPVMIVVARARLLPRSEADSIEPLAKEVVRSAELDSTTLEDDDPICSWFTRDSAALIRAIERSIRNRLVGAMTVTPTGIKLDRISGLAATFYVALFAVCRELGSPFRCSNPTWLRRPKENESKIDVPREVIKNELFSNLRKMAVALANRRDLLANEQGACEVRLADATTTALPAMSVDLLLTSPPYCTRIDYTAATRIELAVLAPLDRDGPKELGRRMLGSTQVPMREIEISPKWGPICCDFLEALRKHPSKASSSYYYITHLDYFDKMAKSLINAICSLKNDGIFIIIVQDSYYKEIHNDLPSIITEMSEAQGLRKQRQENFRKGRSMSGINPYTRLYKRPPGSTEVVLCFSKR
jgi:tRNA G10  N-methylase Trm11